MELRVQGLEVRAEGLGFRVQGLGLGGGGVPFTVDPNGEVYVPFKGSF